MDESSRQPDPESVPAQPPENEVDAEAPAPSPVEKGVDMVAVPPAEGDRETQDTMRSISRLEESN